MTLSLSRAFLSSCKSLIQGLEDPFSSFISAILRSSVFAQAYPSPDTAWPLKDSISKILVPERYPWGLLMHYLMYYSLRVLEVDWARAIIMRPRLEQTPYRREEVNCKRARLDYRGALIGDIYTPLFRYA